ncbi:uncharacterized protein LOC121367383 [Gigantopelta aegis]|uniref:uncharacterized protein LOC121367383 n=1 Tax=Gigantopelta aegis TaxID=1735272 RepID=UPI001B889D46|nr:uncharacterized protein LOC121367383 [Gigantopelta aegis]
MVHANYITFVFVFSRILTQIQGQLCGQFECAPNAVCQGGLCMCSPGFIGSGRFLCVSQAARCPCLSFGDPHTMLYDGQRVRTILPCEFVYTEFTSPVVSGMTCSVQVRLVTERRPTQANRFRQFVKEIVAVVTRDNTRLDIVASQAGINIQTTSTGAGTNPDPDITPIVSQMGQIHQVILTECDTAIGFNPTLGSGFVDAPRAATFPPQGLCGNCDGMQNDNPFDNVAGATPSEKDLALSLRQLSTTQSTNDSATCTAVSASAMKGTCTNDATLIAGVRACSVFIMDSPYRDCLFAMGVGTKENLLFTFNSCLDLYCTPNTAAACGLVNSLSQPGINCALPTGYTCV